MDWESSAAKISYWELECINCNSVGGRSPKVFERLCRDSFKIYNILANSSLCTSAVAGFKEEKLSYVSIGSWGLNVRILQTTQRHLAWNWKVKNWSCTSLLSQGPKASNSVSLFLWLGLLYLHMVQCGLPGPACTWLPIQGLAAFWCSLSGSSDPLSTFLPSSCRTPHLSSTHLATLLHSLACSSAFSDSSNWQLLGACSEPSSFLYVSSLDLWFSNIFVHRNYLGNLLRQISGSQYSNSVVLGWDLGTCILFLGDPEAVTHSGQAGFILWL